MSDLRIIFPVGLALILPAGPASGDDAASSAREVLTTLPYCSGYTPAEKDTGVKVWDRKRSAPGWNFYVPGHRPAAYLIDMEGDVLHQWSLDYNRLWPARRPVDHWRKAFLFDNGDILAIYEGPWGALVKLDRTSRPIWSYTGLCPHGGPHHDLDLAPDGKIFVLTSRRITDRDYKGISMKGPFMEDYITVLSPEGKVIRSFSLIEAFQGSAYEHFLKSMRKAGDIFHTNTLKILRGPGVAETGIFSPGGLMISIPHMDTIAVIDPETEKVVWALAEGWDAQHQPTLLDNGNILLFDNKGNDGNSRVIEIEPVSGGIEIGRASCRAGGLSGSTGGIRPTVFSPRPAAPISG